MVVSQATLQRVITTLLVLWAFSLNDKLTISQDGNLHSKLAGVNFRGPTSVSPSRQQLDNRRIVNVIIAKDFNFAKEDVQIQTLEASRSS